MPLSKVVIIFGLFEEKDFDQKNVKNSSASRKQEKRPKIIKGLKRIKLEKNVTVAIIFTKKVRVEPN